MEISLRDPKIIKKEELKEALKKNSMTLTALGTGLDKQLPAKDLLL